MHACFIVCTLFHCLRSARSPAMVMNGYNNIILTGISLGIVAGIQATNGEYVAAATHFLLAVGNIFHAMGVQCHTPVTFFRFIAAFDEMVVWFGHEVIEACVEHNKVTDDSTAQHDKHASVLLMKIDDLCDELSRASAELNYCCSAFGAATLSSLVFLAAMFAVICFHVHADKVSACARHENDGLR